MKSGDDTPPRIFYGWWVVAVSILGLSIGPGQFAFASLGLFMVPLGDEFGWDRAQISLALTVFTVALALSLPIAGRGVDRWGSRRILVPSIVACGVGLAAIPLLATHLWSLLVIFALIGSLGAGANSLPYMLTISNWFDRRRGLAIGVAMAGAGAGYAYVPPLVQYMIDGYGWRSGYFVLAGITLLIGVPLIALFLQESPADRGLRPDGLKENPAESEPETLLGVDRSEALRTTSFWILFMIFGVMAFSLYGLLPHLVPMLMDRGMDGGKAALVASTIGVTIIVARVIIGYLIDRFFAPRVALVFFLASAGGIAMLAAGATGPMAYLAAVLIGLSIGAEIDLMAFLTTRYFGLRCFGEIYGLMFAALLIGTSFGPIAFGMAFETMGSYVWILAWCAVLNAVVSFATLMLPRYREFAVADPVRA
jgi:MFS family permease